ncbi:MAG: Uma2 family endonuclease [Candidatus Pedobacter colombiensis]|uniref:Uma2 family endonuclease n=1 Tax=Candidatus Pedobacter colombiensis TaxID=3121371 RepID=A0AAJ5W9R4_9SPHI|nr:Uma2 family endonuclease [Pedobacter sp.]WEK20601.1 MAG: Uma2 family endonuclease [Pedobacter sp.]
MNDDSVKKTKPHKKPKSYLQKETVVHKVSDIDLSRTYSYANYLKWEITERLELIKGKIFEMSVPSPNHQRVLGRIQFEMYLFLKGQSCEVFAAPFDVRFPDQSKANKDVYTVLQPDICVVCDGTKVDKQGCIGAPDIVVEVLSPTNNTKELKNKFAIYEEYGVREYWVVHPKKRTFLKYVLNDDGVFVVGELYEGGSEFVSDILPGFRLNIDEVFGVMK